MTLKQYTAVYKGRVQGVGFRYATVDIAAQFKDLTGYVRNVPDGSVEVVAEGNEKTCMEFLEAIDSSHLKRWIFDSRHDSLSINQRHYKNFNLYVE